MREISTKPEDETLSLKDAAQLLHIGVECLRKLVERGEIPALSLNQKHLVFLRKDIIDFISERAREQQTARQQQRTAKATQSCRPSPGRRRRELPDLSRYERVAALPKLSS